MNRRKLSVVAASLSSALVLALIGIEQGWAQTSKTAYPNMAPLDQYLMADRDAEIALARSAAPDAISGDARIQVLGRHGYETAVEGKNGFVCLVERGWMSPPMVGSFGALRFGAQSVSIRQPCVPFCRPLTRGQTWC